jgi:hypothetical protein
VPQLIGLCRYVLFRLDAGQAVALQNIVGERRREARCADFLRLALSTGSASGLPAGMKAFEDAAVLVPVLAGPARHARPSSPHRRAVPRQPVMIGRTGLGRRRRMLGRQPVESETKKSSGVAVHRSRYLLA